MTDRNERSLEQVALDHHLSPTGFELLKTLALPQIYAKVYNRRGERPEGEWDYDSDDDGTEVLDTESIQQQRASKADVSMLPPWIRFNPLQEDYELLQQLGEGTHGAVFRVRPKDEKDPHEYAAKMFRVEDVEIEVLTAEIEALAECQSDHVVQFRGVHLLQDEVWLLMELCAGSVLDMINKTGMTLTEMEIRAVTAQTLIGLHVIHGKNFIHRDIKAANLLVTKEGQVRIADFGVLARMRDRLSQRGELTRRTSVIGTSYWMAPEILGEDESGYDEAADIWSVGITAIEMANGEPPRFGLHPARAMYLTATSPAPTLDDDADWTPAFHDFISKSLTKHAENRPSVNTLLRHPFVIREVSMLLGDIMPTPAMPHPCKTLRELLKLAEKPVSEVETEPVSHLIEKNIRKYRRASAIMYAPLTDLLYTNDSANKALQDGDEEGEGGTDPANATLAASRQGSRKQKGGAGKLSKTVPKKASMEMLMDKHTAVLAQRFVSQEARVPIRSTRLALVGNMRAGKSSLLEALKGNPPPGGVPSAKQRSLRLREVDLAAEITRTTLTSHARSERSINTHDSAASAASGATGASGASGATATSHAKRRSGAFKSAAETLELIGQKDAINNIRPPKSEQVRETLEGPSTPHPSISGPESGPFSVANPMARRSHPQSELDQVLDDGVEEVTTFFCFPRIRKRQSQSSHSSSISEKEQKTMKEWRAKLTSISTQKNGDANEEKEAPKMPARQASPSSVRFVDPEAIGELEAVESQRIGLSDAVGEVKVKSVPAEAAGAEEEDPEDLVALTVFDFGGQEMFQSMQHLFLSNHGVQTLVFNLEDFFPKLGLSAVSEKTAVDDLSFWLHTLRVFAPAAKVLMVGTHKDTVVRAMSATGSTDGEAEFIQKCEDLSRNFEDVFAAEQLENVVPYNDAPGRTLVFHPTSSHRSGREDAVLDIVRNKINELAVSDMIWDHDASKNIPFVEQPLPASWIKIADALAEVAGRPNILSILKADAKSENGEATTVESLGEAHGLLLESDDERLRQAKMSQMLHRLHELGRIFYVEDGPGVLNEDILLKPQWLLDSLSRICRDFEAQPLPMDEAARESDPAAWDDLVSHGVLRPRLLQYIWAADTAGSQARSKDYLIDFLEFSLLITPIEGEDDAYLLPLVLSANGAAAYQAARGSGEEESLLECAKIKFEDWHPRGFDERVLVELLEEGGCRCISMSAGAATLLVGGVEIGFAMDHQAGVLTLSMPPDEYRFQEEVGENSCWNPLLWRIQDATAVVNQRFYNEGVRWQFQVLDPRENEFMDADICQPL